jgi:hypothetical protein
MDLNNKLKDKFKYQSHIVTLGAFSNITKDITKSGRYVGTIARYVGE